MLRLFDNPYSGNCYKIRLLLAQLDIPYERVPVKLLYEAERDEELTSRNVARRVPVLEWDDGRVLAESNAILFYVAGNTELLPDDPLKQAQVLRWMFFEQNAPEPNIGVARYLKQLTRTADQHPALFEHRRAGGIAALKVMETYLESGREFFAGDYSIADIALYAYPHLAAQADIDLEPFRRVREWFSRVASQPRYVPMLGGPTYNR